MVNPENKGWKDVIITEIHGYYILEARKKSARVEKDIDTSDTNGKRKRIPNKMLHEHLWDISRKKSKTVPSSSSSSVISSGGNMSLPRMSPSHSGIPNQGSKPTEHVKNIAAQESHHLPSSDDDSSPEQHLQVVSAPGLRDSSRMSQDGFLNVRSLDKKFQQHVVSTLAYLKLRLDQIHENQVQIQERLSRSTSGHLPTITLSLPVKSLEDLDELEWKVTNNPEQYAELATRLDWVGGKNVRDCTFKTMQKVLTNEVACGLNWVGHNGKKGLKYYELSTIISNCIHGFFEKKDGNIASIESAMNDWLKAAPTRASNAAAKKNGNSVSN
ncbi:unnamed protein product [Allacma fusca]|uniref:DUF4806 domain-containing protein n=1 Tax=Allacma fusca TaxID=39272 RepID=A0A8J2KT88_9HEXA|nr:unnamed protein product [Allacma fusca]